MNGLLQVLCWAGVGVGLCAGVWSCVLLCRLRAARRQISLQRAIIDCLPGYIFAKDVDDECRYVFLNNVYDKLAGGSARAHIGENDREWERPQHMEFWEQDMQLIRSGKKELCEVETVYDSLGTPISAKLHKKVIETDDGRKLIVGMGIDVTRERDLERKLTQNIHVLDAHVQNERTINRCLSMISSGDDIKQTIPFVLQALGEKSNADRCGVFLFDETGTTFKVYQHWSRAEDAMPLEDAAVFQTADFGSLYSRLQDRFPIMIEDVRRPPEGLEALCIKLDSLKIRATMVFGIWENDRLFGMAISDYHAVTRRFTEADQQRLQNVCTCFLLAWERDRRLNEIAKGATMLRQIFESITVPIMLFDLDFNVVTANSQTEESTGVKLEDIIGRKCYNALCFHDSPPEFCPMLRTVKERKAIQIDYEGHGRQYIITTHPVYDHDGKMVYVLETAFDVTKQKEQERQLQTMNLMLNNASEIASITYFTGDHEANATLIGGAEDIGLPADGMPHSLHDWIIPEDHEELDIQRHKVLSDSSYMADIVCRSDATGMRRSYRLIVQRSRHDESICVGILQDITSSVTLENERQDLIRSLHNYVENEKIVNACLAQIAMEDDCARNEEEVLKIIAARFGCDRLFVGAYDEEDGLFRAIHEWVGEGVTPRKGLGDLFLQERFSAWKPLFMEDDLLSIGDVEHSDHAVLFEKYGCRTFLCAPIWVNRKFYGILGISFLRERRDISDLDENILRSAANLLGMAREREIQRDALMELDRQTSLIFNVMPVPVCFFNMKRELIRCNKAAADLFEHSQEEMLNRPCYETMCLMPGGHPECPISTVIETGVEQMREIVVGTRECQLLAIPIFDGRGKLVNVIESLFDVTELKEGKRHLELALTAAEAANRAKSFFFATMSHELRTPLNAVIGFSELLQSSELSREEQEEYLASINLAGNSLLYLVNDILDLSKLEADQMVLVPQETDVAALLQELRSVFSYKVRTQNLYFDLILPEHLPTLKLDSLRLRQVLLNLIGNAVKFTPQGGITVRVEFHPTGQGVGTLVLGVKDTGIGVKKDAQEKIFEPFIQQDAHRDTHAYKGSGLGLAITKRLINRMNGTITLESEVGKGSDFVVELRDIAYVGAPLALAEDVRDWSGEGTRGFRVLLVDDIALNLKVLCAMLRKLDVECLTADSGDAALEVLRKDRRFDALLTDMWMPGMNGAELASAIHAEFKDISFPIVAVTADTEAGENFSREHFTGILLKPITVEKMQKLFALLKSGDSGWNVL